MYTIDVDGDPFDDAIGACVMKSLDTKDTRKVNQRLVVNIKSNRVGRTSSAWGPLLET